MKNHRLTQYLIIIIILAGIAGGYFYYQSRGSEKINSSQSSKLTSGLAGYWTMDGNDTSWSGNTATLTNRGSIGSGANGNSSGMSQSTTPTIGKIGQSLNFDGSDDYITIPYSSSFSLTGSFTISGWLKKTNTTNQALMAKSAGLQGRNFGYWAGSTVSFDKGGAAIITGSTTIQAGQWYHTVLTYNGSQLSLYLNGQSDATPVSMTALTNSSYDLQIGARWRGDESSLGNYFNGSIDEVRIYNDRALSASEITELYNQGQEKINASQTSKLTSGLVGYWTFDGADVSGTTVSDKNPTATKYNGTIYNAVPVIGKIGQALNFDGSGDYVIANIIPSINKTGPYSFSVWVKSNANPAGQQTIFQNSNASNDRNCMSISTNSASFGYYNGSSWVGASGSITNPTNWNYLVGINNGGSLSLYINGVLQVGTSVPYCLIGSNVYLGQTTNSEVRQYLNGVMDEVRIYNRALAVSEITELYNQGQEKINASQSTKLTSGLAGYWTMDGGDMNATQALDKSPVGTNTGTLTGTTRGIGKIGQGLSFNGTSDYVGTTNLTGFTNSTPFSFSAWIKTTDADRGIIFGNYISGAATSFEVNAAGQLRVYLSDGINIKDYRGTSPTINTGSWVHVAATYDGAQNLILYANGTALSLTKTTNGTLSGSLDSGSPMRIGVDNRATPGTTWFAGNIDEVREYNRELSASEITELYNQGR